MRDIVTKEQQIEAATLFISCGRSPGVQVQKCWRRRSARHQSATSCVPTGLLLFETQKLKTDEKLIAPSCSPRLDFYFERPKGLKAHTSIHIGLNGEMCPVCFLTLCAGRGSNELSPNIDSPLAVWSRFPTSVHSNTAVSSGETGRGYGGDLWSNSYCK